MLCFMNAMPPVGGEPVTAFSPLEVHTMPRLLPVSAALLGLLSVGTVRAYEVVIDDFNAPIPAIVVRDSTTGDGAVTNLITQQLKVDGNLSSTSLATSRIVTAEFLQNNSATGNPTQSNIQATVGGTSGRLTINDTAGDVGVVTVKWSIPVFTLANPATAFLSVLTSQVGGAANTVDFQFTGTGSNAGNSFTLPQVSTGYIPFTSPPGVAESSALSVADALTFSSGGDLLLTFSGGQGWNLIIDKLSIEVPEPASLALVGLALVGAGVAMRRRKA
jgi:hypothetical protein